VPLLLFANKQDVRACMGAAEISAAMRLTELRHADWHIQACSALTGDG
jgi:ADP-ribosylation factor-like protein 5B